MNNTYPKLHEKGLENILIGLKHEYYWWFAIFLSFWIFTITMYYFSGKNVIFIFKQKLMICVYVYILQNIPMSNQVG